jgi:AraC-like DNA-binding protein
VPAILNPGLGRQKFRFSAPAAAPGLQAFVEHYWIIHWDLRGQEPHEQRVLPHPAVNVTFKPGRCRVAGVPLGRFQETLEGAGVTRVDELASDFALSVRQVQRLSADHIGVSPKWVIRRQRLHEAAARITAGTPVDLGELAAELGYSDQPHLTRDFTSMVGEPPAHHRRAQENA